MITFDEFTERYKEALQDLTNIEKRYRYAYYLDGYIDGKEKASDTIFKKLGYISGTCKCGEPINNAEYDICPQCRQEAIEYQRDVNEER